MPDKRKSELQLTEFEQSVAQRMMLSFRYFCPSEPNTSSQALSEPCKEAVTQLPTELAELIEETSLGGVVLFAENLQSYRQIIQLTRDLQTASLNSASKKPLFIGIDQEGGRVVRLPLPISTAFSGNMAIGATYSHKGHYYAQQVGRILAKELKALGINLNFAPDVDINSNPENPVINVRSFGQDPQQVADQGIAMMEAMQAEKVMATLKHFPGHGNTNVDSHTGLPMIDYDLETSRATDLLPFVKAIHESDPAMIMTAHIQYPGLDPSQLVTMSGESIVKPATMSSKILTQLLREEIGFQGVVITDALNMASISHNFDPVFATSQSLLAGSDIALMPFKIRYPSDLDKFKRFVQQVAKQMAASPEALTGHQQSLARLDKLANSYQLASNLNTSVEQQVLMAKKILASDSHRAMQKSLAMDSITLLKNSKQQPLEMQLGKRLHFLFQDLQKEELVRKILSQLFINKPSIEISASQLASDPLADIKQKIDEADSLLVFYSSKRESAVVQGEFEEGEVSYAQLKQAEQQRLAKITDSLAYAKQRDKTCVTLGMQSPYELSELAHYSDILLLAYDAAIYSHAQMDLNLAEDEQEYIGVTYEAILNVLFGRLAAKGELPVSLPADKKQDLDANQRMMTD